MSLEAQEAPPPRPAVVAGQAGFTSLEFQRCHVSVRTVIFAPVRQNSASCGMPDEEPSRFESAGQLHARGLVPMRGP